LKLQHCIEAIFRNRDSLAILAANHVEDIRCLGP
jgi:hypothetical protein